MLSRLVSIVKHMAQVDIVKVFSLNAISTLVRMLTGLISVKIVSSIVGPSGVALLGQLNNFVTILLGVANGGINNGITKYVAEYKEDEKQIKIILSNALKVTLFFTFFISLGLIICHKYLSKVVMLSDDYGYIFLIFGFTIVLYSLNTFLISILNGYKEFKKYVVINIIGSVISLCFTVILVLWRGLEGALISAVTFQSVVFFATFFLCRNCVWNTLGYYKNSFDKRCVRKLLSYSLMSVVSISVLPLGQMFLRGYAISEISMEDAGWWEGMNRLSGVYLGIITTSFVVYYLPRLSEIKDRIELRAEIFRCYKVILPLLLMGFVAIYLFRYLIIDIVFSPAFYPMEGLFVWQLIGDFFKIASWLLAFLMIAKSMTTIYIITEVFFVLSRIVLCYVFMQYNGTVGLVQGYLINYVLYTIAMLVIFRKLIFLKK